MIVLPQPVPLTLNVSASQIKTADLCWRKWWFDKVVGVREKQKHHLHLGHALHAIGERFILGQFTTEDDLFFPGWNDGLEGFEQEWMKRVVRRAIAIGIWSAMPDAYVEFPILYLTGHQDADGLPLMAAANTYEDKDKVRRHGKPAQLIDGSPLPAGWDASPLFVGFIDVLQLGAEPMIADHKSAKSRKYTLSKADLAEDGQVLSYAAAAWQLSGARKPVRLRHNVFIKAEVAIEKQVFATDAEAPIERIVQQWQHNRMVIAEMTRLRAIAPKVEDPDRRKRAANWLKVPAAIDQGRAREACECYGGCPFREACFGRARIETVIQQLDAPSIAGAMPNRDEGRKVKSFGPLLFTAPPPLLFKHPPQTPGLTMLTKPPAPITSPAVTLGSDCYIKDPDQPLHQYKARVIAFGGAPGSGDVAIKLWPVHDVMPKFDVLPVAYSVEVPTAVLSHVPHAGATVVGYAAALLAGGFTSDLITWEPEGPTIAAMTTNVSDAKITKRAPDDKFGLLNQLNGGGSPVPPTSPAATVGDLEHVPKVPQPAEVGQVLRVAESVNAFWAPLKGKLATVRSVVRGDTENDWLYNVEILGLPYENVLAGRFEYVAVAGPVSGYDPAADIQTKARALKGKLVNITVTYTQSPFNVLLDDVTDAGISAIGGQVTPRWDQIVDIKPLTEQSIPHLVETKGKGKEIDKLETDVAAVKEKTAKQLEKEAKAAAKEDIKRAKEAAKQAAADAKQAIAEGKAKLAALSAQDRPAPPVPVTPDAHLKLDVPAEVVISSQLVFRQDSPTGTCAPASGIQPPPHDWSLVRTGAMNVGARYSKAEIDTKYAEVLTIISETLTAIAQLRDMAYAGAKA